MRVSVAWVVQGPDPGAATPAVMAGRKTDKISSWMAPSEEASSLCKWR